MKQRILLYSHDSYGLGHLRRSMRLAQAAIEGGEARSVLVLTGSDVASKFDWPVNADFIRMPSVTKLPSGDYGSECDGLGLQEVLSLRSEILLTTVKEYRPDVFVVDKTPLGLMGEAEKALLWLSHNHHCRLVLGLRDILDEPSVVSRELGAPKVQSALADQYNEIWIYGCKGVYDAVAKYPVLAGVSHKVVYTGYWSDLDENSYADKRGLDQGEVLVTSGGGADGFRLMDNFLDMYAKAGGSTFPATMVSGPFLDENRTEELAQRCADSSVRFHSFHASMEQLMDQSQCVVCMGGYNTICEVVGRGIPCVIVPREHPRREQALRAEAFERLGLASMLSLEALSPEALAEKVRQAHENGPSRLPTSISFGASRAVQGRLDALFMELS